MAQEMDQILNKITFFTCGDNKTFAVHGFRLNTYIHV
jgi:hypothetical protein